MRKPVQGRAIRRKTAPAERFEAGRRWLMKQDPRFTAVIKKMGRRRPNFDPRDPFHSLVRAVISQQLSTKAADTIEARVLELMGGEAALTPTSLLVADQNALRAAGLSWSKISYLRDLATHIVDGRLDLHGLRHESDAEIIAAITAVKGFGVWSAEMFLMFCLYRPDVFPVGDLGIVKGMQLLTGMKVRPKPRTMNRVAALWTPHRSVACWYLWRLLE